jgi:hypothetical protein
MHIIHTFLVLVVCHKYIFLVFDIVDITPHYDNERDRGRGGAGTSKYLNRLSEATPRIGGTIEQRSMAVPELAYGTTWKKIL